MMNLNGKETLRLDALLDACISLACEACGVIRDIQQRRESVGGDFEATLKNPTDSSSYLTEADVAAQKTIVTGLRMRFPNLDIVGEEDEEVGGAPATAPAGMPFLPHVSTSVTSTKGLSFDYIVPVQYW